MLITIVTDIGPDKCAMFNLTVAFVHGTDSVSHAVELIRIGSLHDFKVGAHMF